MVLFVAGHPHEGREGDQEQRVDGLRSDGEDDHPDGRFPALRRGEPGLPDAQGLRHGSEEARHHPEEGTFCVGFIMRQNRTGCGGDEPSKGCLVRKKKKSALSHKRCEVGHITEGGGGGKKNKWCCDVFE